MENRYSRNRIYISDSEQDSIKDFPILLGGCGIGSVIAECALRLGFENITIIDGDKVELTNLNRQNYSEKDIDVSKVDSIKARLKSINNKANINVHNCFLTTDNIREIIDGHKVAINALDFTTDVPLAFDSMCQELNIPVLHPYNLGFGGLVTVINPKGFSLKNIAKSGKRFNEVNVVEYASSYMEFWGNKQAWLKNIIEKYKQETQTEIIAPPQLSIASYILGGICTHILYNIATNKNTKVFPEFYLSTLMNN